MEEAAALAKKADVAIVVVGNHPECNAGWDQCPTPSNGKEDVDRKTIVLEQEELVKKIFAANPKTIEVLRSSFPYAIVWSQQNVPAIVHMTHNSQEEGHGLADVLFGDYSPGGATDADVADRGRAVAADPELQPAGRTRRICTAKRSRSIRLDMG